MSTEPLPDGGGAVAAGPGAPAPARPGVSAGTSTPAPDRPGMPAGPATVGTAADISPPVGQGHGVERDHSHGLTDIGYVRIAIILAAVTAAEVIWSYIPAFDGARGATHLLFVFGLLAMMAFKFVFVASNFMHLKFDDKLLTQLFYTGLLLAVTVYVIALFTFHVFRGAHY